MGPVARLVGGLLRTNCGSSDLRPGSGLARLCSVGMDFLIGCPALRTPRRRTTWVGRPTRRFGGRGASMKRARPSGATRIAAVMALLFAAARPTRRLRHQRQTPVRHEWSGSGLVGGDGGFPTTFAQEPRGVRAVANTTLLFDSLVWKDHTGKPSVACVMMGGVPGRPGGVALLPPGRESAGRTVRHSPSTTSSSATTTLTNGCRRRPQLRGPPPG